MGMATPPRPDLGFSRMCGKGLIPILCPGSLGQANTTSNSAGYETGGSYTDDWDVRIPKDLASLYQGGLKSLPPTVSSILDIQGRLYTLKTIPTVGNRTYYVSEYRTLANFVLNNKTELVEGLILDTQKPRIGFRNHTVPMQTQIGAEWDEDILFLEPITSCSDTNLTVKNKVTTYGFADVNEWVVDKGGFSQMAVDSPWEKKMGHHVWYNNTQQDPQLDWRAFATGWSANAMLAYFLNITNPEDRTAYMHSSIDEAFPTNGSLGYTTINQVVITEGFDAIGRFMLPLGSNLSSLNDSIINEPVRGGYWPNPFSISWANYSLLSQYCAGFGEDLGGAANISNIQVKCGIVSGTARPLDGEPTSLVPIPGSLWERRVYSCASATKASIKTVRLRYNSTYAVDAPMRGLEVVHIDDKMYVSPDEMPLWGVENPNMDISDLDLFWGLIDEKDANHANLSTVRSDHLYLPAGRSSSSQLISEYDDYFPGASLPAAAWRTVYDAATEGDITTGMSYSGLNSVAMYKKWSDLSHDLEGAATMLNLIWTDLAANALVGTKSWLPQDPLPPNLQNGVPAIRRRAEISTSTTADVPVQTFHRAIRYRWRYGIPAFLAAFVVACILVATMGAVVFRRGTPQLVGQYLTSLSAGRLLTHFLLPKASSSGDTKDWASMTGAVKVSVLGSNYSIADSTKIHQSDAAEKGGHTTSYQRVAQEEPVYTRTHNTAST
jgi:hypothetical protein